MFLAFYIITRIWKFGENPTIVQCKPMNKNKENNAYGVLTVVMVALAGVLLGLLIAPRNNRVNLNSAKLSKLDDAMELIENYYVDKTDSDTLTEQMIAAMLSALDPHSHYLSVNDLKTESETIRGNFEGVGMQLEYVGDTACVSQVFQGGPGEKAGLQPGDRLLSVNGVKIAGAKMSKEDIVNHLRGPHHSVANITVHRYGEKANRRIQVRRDIIETPSIPYSGMLDKQTGYIRLTRFSETSAQEFHDAVAKLKQQGMKSLIFDLRGNGGGLLVAAIDIADELLPNKELIVYTKGAHQRRQDIHSHRGGLFAQGKLAILIDENSASASEVVSGAIQDNDRGIVIGRRSFGKGLVQRQFNLEDGSAIWLTTARYYTPSGRCIQRSYDKGTDEYYAEYLQQMIASATSDSLLTKITDTTKYYTTKGRVVYGGGGIYPDFPLKMHSDSCLVYFNKMIDKGIINQFAFRYITRNYTQLRKKYTSANDFVRNFSVDDAMFKQLINYAAAQGLPRNAHSIAKYNDNMRLMLKALISESLFYSETYYRIMLQSDLELSDARKIFQQHK